MSKEVDERVVEMRFNNALFESKVQQTMRSLAALNEKLMFKGAEKGFEKVSDFIREGKIQCNVECSGTI